MGLLIRTGVAALVLAGCGGHGASNAVPQTPEASAAAGAQQAVTMNLVIGGPAAQSASRSPKFVSLSTSGVLIQVYSHGDASHSTVIGTSAIDVSPGSAACGGQTGARTCALPVPAPPGTDDFVVTLFDAPPSAGSFASANILGIGNLTQTIAVGVNNSVSIAVGGVISTYGASTTYASLAANGQAQQYAIAVAPADFDNNTITAGVSDPFANPIAVSVVETGGSGHASLSLNGGTAGPSATLMRSTDNVVLKYDGGGSAGYSIQVKLGATGVSSQTITVSPLYVTSTSPFYSSGTLSFLATGQTATLQISEANAPGGTSYVAVPSVGCINLASIGSVVGSGASASVLVTAGSTGGSGCTIAINDGTPSTVNVPVNLTTIGGTVTVTGPTLTEYPIPTAGSGPGGITSGPDGALWFTEGGTVGKIARITTTGTVTEYPIPSSYGSPGGIVLGPDGALWFTEDEANKIGRITAAGAITEYTIPWEGSLPTNGGIASGSDGALWFTVVDGYIGRITTTGAISQFAVPTTNSTPNYIAAGPDGALWFTEQNGNNIGRITTTGTITEFALPTGSSFPQGITSGPDGALWFGEGNGVGRITTAGSITVYPVPSGSGSWGITSGPDGALWFTETGPNRIGRITTAGNVTEYTLPAVNSFSNIVSGPDGAIWFTYGVINQIGRLK